MKKLRRVLPVIAAFLGLALLSACGSKTPAVNTVATGVTQTTTTAPKMILTSTAFENNGTIPALYTCSGDNISPPLAWKNLPEGTKSLCVILDDPDAKLFAHWVIFNIPPNATGLNAGIPTVDTLADGSLQGYNSAKTLGYTGPCPPFGETHHYRFRLYALDTMINLPAGTSKAQLLEKMTGHTLNNETAELIGIFQR